MLHHEVGNGGTQMDRVEWLGCDEHQGLIPMLSIREILLEEPVLNGRKWDHTIDNFLAPLISKRQSIISQGGQVRYGRGLKNLL